MERGTLIKQCRYYKGEAENPFDGQGTNDALFWFYEQRWVELTIQQDSYLQWMADEYTRRGLADFHAEISIGLRAILYNRYDHWLCGGNDDFKNWFEQDYLKDGANENR